MPSCGFVISCGVLSVTTRHLRSKPLLYYYSTAERRARWRARSRVRYMVASGKLRREPCEVCGASPVVMFHQDYRYREAVRWFCYSHFHAHMLAIAAGDEPAQVNAIDEEREPLLPFNDGGRRG